MNETISIIIPTYNYARYLSVTLRNVLAQQGVETEIIVVDDGSTDDTEQVAASFGKKIRYVRQLRQGPSAARNVGMALARGGYVMFLDSDDLMMPGALRSQLDCLRAHPEAGLVHCITDFFTASSPEGDPCPLEVPPFFCFTGFEHVHLCALNFLPIHSLLMRRAVLETVGRFDESLPAHEDHDYWFRCALAGFTFCLNPVPLMLYRKHQQSLSSQRIHHFLGGAMVRRRIAQQLDARPAVMAGERLEAFIAAAAGHLLTLRMLYGREPEACLALHEMAVQALHAATVEQRKQRHDDSKEKGLLRMAYLLRIVDVLEKLRTMGVQHLEACFVFVKKLAPQLPFSGQAYQNLCDRVAEQIMLLPVPRLTDLSRVEPFATERAARAAEQAHAAEAVGGAAAPVAGLASPAAAEGAPAVPRPVKISVVMATFNAEKYLERALQSVLGQSWPQVELIVQDGGSTDGTADIVRRHLARIAHFASAPDKGVYDAWNKALPHVSGDWVLFLGADDFLADVDVLERCAEHLARVDERVIFAYGALVMVRDGDATLVLDRSLHDVMHAFTSDMGLPFPATFCRAAFLKKRGFDDSYRIAGDFAMAAGAITLEGLYRLPVHVTYMESGSGLSTGAENRQQLMLERARVLQEIVLPRATEIVAGCAASSLMRERLWR